MIGRRRDKLEIIMELLTAADHPHGANKTKLVYQSNLNFNRLEGFLQFLLEKELVEENEDNNRYITTVKGRQFLQQLKTMQKML